MRAILRVPFGACFWKKRNLSTCRGNLSQIIRQPWPTQSKNGFTTSWLEENPLKFLFLKPNLLIDGMIAQVSLKKYFFPNFWAYQSFRDQTQAGRNLCHPQAQRHCLFFKDHPASSYEPLAKTPEQFPPAFLYLLVTKISTPPEDQISFPR
jgi:hypothetical protein